jgi:hypothetical protein
MSSTDPQGGAGRQWPGDAANLNAGDDHGGGGGVNPEAVRAGHEPDAFAVKPIMGIPIAVVASFVIAFTVAGFVFAYFMGNVKDNPMAHQEAVDRGKAPLNERLERIERAGLEKDPLREVDQPRLEPLKRLEGDGLAYTRPELPTGNSPQIHPEEILPNRVPALQRAGYVGADKKFARIPIEAAMRLAVEQEDVLPVRKEQSKPVPSYEKPSAASAGRGVMPAAPKAEVNKNGAPKKKAEPDPKKKTPEKK